MDSRLPEPFSVDGVKKTIMGFSVSTNSGNRLKHWKCIQIEILPSLSPPSLSLSLFPVEGCGLFQFDGPNPQKQ